MSDLLRISGCPVLVELAALRGFTGEWAAVGKETQLASADHSPKRPVGYPGAVMGTLVGDRVNRACSDIGNRLRDRTTRLRPDYLQRA